MKRTGMKCYFTNHSLRATATTRTYKADIDEATIMERTCHWSVNGVQSYKRESSKLNDVTSNVLNRCKRTKTYDVPQPKSTPSTSKENALKAIESIVPAMNFHNASNFSINFILANDYAINLTHRAMCMFHSCSCYFALYSLLLLLCSNQIMCTFNSFHDVMCFILILCIHFAPLVRRCVSFRSCWSVFLIASVVLWRALAPVVCAL